MCSVFLWVIIWHEHTVYLSIILFCVIDFSQLLLMSTRGRHSGSTCSNYTFVIVEAGGKLCFVSKEKGRQWIFFFTVKRRLSLNRFKFHARARLKNPDGSLVEMLLRWQSYLSLVMVDILCWYGRYVQSNQMKTVRIPLKTQRVSGATNRTRTSNPLCPIWCSSIKYITILDIAFIKELQEEEN